MTKYENIFLANKFKETYVHSIEFVLGLNVLGDGRRDDFGQVMTCGGHFHHVKAWKKQRI